MQFKEAFLKTNQNKEELWIFGIAFISAVIIFCITPAFPNGNPLVSAVAEFVIILVLGLSGLKIVQALGWGNLISGTGIDRESKGGWQIVCGLGLFIILFNTYLWAIYHNQIIQNTPWVGEMNTPIMAVLFSIKAALSEEIVFRLFIFSLSVWLLNKVLRSRNTAVIIGIIISAIVFALPHGGSPFSFFCGVVLAYIFYKKGLVTAMVVHFLTDLIPFVLFTLR